MCEKIETESWKAYAKRMNYYFDCWECSILQEHDADAVEGYGDYAVCDCVKTPMNKETIIKHELYLFGELKESNLGKTLIKNKNLRKDKKDLMLAVSGLENEVAAGEEEWVKLKDEIKKLKQDKDELLLAVYELNNHNENLSNYFKPFNKGHELILKKDRTEIEEIQYLENKIQQSFEV